MICCCLSAARAADSTPEQKQLLSTLQKEVQSVNEQLQKEAQNHQAIRDDLNQVRHYDNNMCNDSIFFCTVSTGWYFCARA